MKYAQGCEYYKNIKSPAPTQMVQQVNNDNNSNSDYQMQQLEIQRQQLKAQQDQTAAIKLAADDAEFSNISNQLNQRVQDIRMHRYY